MAQILTRATGGQIVADVVSLEERTQRAGTSAAFGDVWNDRVGYPARPHHAATYGLTTTTLQQWAPQQDWQSPTT